LVNSMRPRRGTRTTTEIFQRELNLTCTGRCGARRCYCTVSRFILQKCEERNIVSRRQAGNTLWDQVRIEAIRHITHSGFQGKINSSLNGQYRAFHTVLDTLIRNMLNKAAESGRNAKLNSDAEAEEEGNGPSGSGSRDPIACPKVTIHEEKPVRIIFIETTAADPGQTRQLPWIICNEQTPTRSS